MGLKDDWSRRPSGGTARSRREDSCSCLRRRGKAVLESGAVDKLLM